MQEALNRGFSTLSSVVGWQRAGHRNTMHVIKFGTMCGPGLDAFSDELKSMLDWCAKLICSSVGDCAADVR